MSIIKKIKVGIRNSSLSIAQTNEFIEFFCSQYANFNLDNFVIEFITTSGDQYKDIRLDQLGGKGLFSKEIESHLIDERIDLAVHSLKDLPQETSDNLEIVCWLKRSDERDVLLSNNGYTIETLPSNSIIGTSSIRRRSQVLQKRKDLNIKLLRGNVDTRIKKLRNNEYDAIILAHAGVLRLEKEKEINQILTTEDFLPAAGQGSVGIQIHSNNLELKEMLSSITHNETQICNQAERTVLNQIGANCNSPIGVLAKIFDQEIKIACQLLDHNGVILFESNVKGLVEDHLLIAKDISLEILKKIGQEKINQLDSLKDDFNYTP